MSLSVISTPIAAPPRSKRRHRRRHPAGSVAHPTPTASKRTGRRHRRRRPNGGPVTRRNLGALPLGAGQAAGVAAYTAVLNDPFNNKGVPLGFGCMIETNAALAYTRGSLTTAADGSFTIESLSFPDRMLATSTSGAGTNPTYAYTAAANGGALYNTYNFARIVAWGIRVRVLQAATAVPGTLTGVLFSANNNAGVITQPNNANAFPQSHEAYGTEVIEVLYRPTDPADFQFQNFGAGINNPLASATLHVSGVGFPTLSTVGYEVVMHLEAYSTVDAGPADEAASNGSTWSLADYFPSVDSLWRVARPHLTNAVRSSLMDQFTGSNISQYRNAAMSRQMLLGLVG